ncbi:ArsR family transcriptional regulator [Streptomyces sp. B6B3]|uniref:ArsR/SmtB family transcription factor n=1 Tax=Streptomyces sp. B6B3 TaxID=3153570 RepID=UPI00325C4DCF
MSLEERVAELERRVAALAGDGSARRGEPVLGRDTLWALEGLNARLANEAGEAGETGEAGEKAGAGQVLYVGSVRLPTDERFEWQLGHDVGVLLDADWSDAAESLAALGHPVRARLLREILGGRRAVAELAALEGLGTTGQIYHHLRQLTGTGWLHTTSRGRYEVRPERVVPLLVVLAAAKP